MIFEIDVSGSDILNKDTVIMVAERNNEHKMLGFKMTKEKMNEEIIGKGATINCPDSLTHGKPCVIDDWDNKVSKYFVSFEDRKSVV